MKVSLISIGNSKGIRIPQNVLKACQVEEAFDLEVKDKTILLKPIHQRSYDLSFNNILKMNDQEIQTLIRQVSSTTLAIALLGCDQTSKDRVYKNLSKQAFSMIQAEVDRLEGLDAKSLIIEMHRGKIDDALKDLDQ